MMPRCASSVSNCCGDGRSAFRRLARTPMSTSAPRRILIITRNLPPLVGGMERLNWHMAEEWAWAPGNICRATDPCLSDVAELAWHAK